MSWAPARALVFAIAAAACGTVASHASAKQAAGSACLPVPDMRWSVVVTHWPRSGERRAARWTYATERTIDLDRDGQPDALVPVPRARDPQGTCPTDVRRELYLTRGGCGVRVGVIEGELQASPAATTSHGLLDLTTTLTLGPAHGAIEIHYAFDGTTYVERSRTEGVARCDVHPADCEDLPHRTCELRDHPTIRSRFDPEHTSTLLHAAAVTAQRQCLAPAAVIERCDVRPTFSPDGPIARLEVRDCPRRRACVERVFRALSTTPFEGDASWPSISFQIPPP